MIGYSIDGVWNPILHELMHLRWHPRDIRKKLIFVGAVYYIWQEQNRRIFVGNKREVAQLVKELLLYIDMHGGRDVGGINLG
ncbi:hypothetical protein OSB04_024382 [Centaurea solstitialis]|uniref:Uncharacterized protein n=1 Tax=Centaurea solstitialis TaxID=347529 RepID=A0AA38SYC2_9ASTR|nr:hypothetical protein OSB04_024382 [Centaurea solstitialis]